MKKLLEGRKPRESFGPLYVRERVEFFALPNGKIIYGIKPIYSYGLVINPGACEEYTTSSYHTIDAASGSTLLFATNDVSKFVANTAKDYDNDPEYIELYSYTELYLVDEQGREVVLGQIGNSPSKIKGVNIEGGVSFEVSYKMLEKRSGYIDKYDWVIYCRGYDVYYEEGQAFVEVVEKKRKGIEYLYDETQAYRLWFTGEREIITPQSIKKNLKPEKPITYKAD